MLVLTVKWARRTSVGDTLRAQHSERATNSKRGRRQVETPDVEPPTRKLCQCDKGRSATRLAVIRVKDQAIG
jgi:hypothetical protein